MNASLGIRDMWAILTQPIKKDKEQKTLLDGVWIPVLLAAGVFIAGPVIRTVGYVRSFAAFASIASATAIMHVIIVNPYVWVVLRLTHGICLSVMLVVVESWLNVSATVQNRGRILSLYAVVYHASRGLGQPLIGVFSPSGFEIFGVITVLTSLCLVPLALARVTGHPQTRKSPPMLVKTFMRSPLAGFGIVVNGLLFGASWSLIPRYGQQVGVVEAQIGVLMLLVSLGTLAFQWPLGWISDRRDRRKAILLSSVVGFAAALLIAVTRASGALLFALLRVRIVPKLPKVRKRAYRIYPRSSAAAFGLLRKVKRPRARRPGGHKSSSAE
jgi:MFS family permease